MIVPTVCDRRRQRKCNGLTDLYRFVGLTIASSCAPHWQVILSPRHTLCRPPCTPRILFIRWISIALTTSAPHGGQWLSYTSAYKTQLRGKLEVITWFVHYVVFIISCYWSWPSFASPADKWAANYVCQFHRLKPNSVQTTLHAVWQQQRWRRWQRPHWIMFDIVTVPVTTSSPVLC